MTNRILYGKEARKKMYDGIEQLVDVVKVTMGAAGRNVTIIDNLGGSRTTKDGKNVAIQVHRFDYVEQCGVEKARASAIKSAEASGDGTTTATVLTGEMVRLGLENIEHHNPFEVRRGMEKAVTHICNELEKVSEKIETKEMLVELATTSANHNNEVGNTIGSLVYKLGSEAGYILSKELVDKTKISVTEGYKYDKGLYTPYFTQVAGSISCSFGKAKVLLVQDNIGKVEDIKRVVAECNAKNPKEPLVILMETISTEAVTWLIKNKMSPDINLQVAVVELPNFNEMRHYSVHDIARCTGAKVFNRDLDMDIAKATYADLGDIDSFKSDELSTVFVFNDQGRIEANALIEEMKESVKTLEGAKEEHVKERIRRLSTGVATIQIGANTQQEHEEMFDLYEDALEASKSAMSEGVIVGGGLTLMEIGDNMQLSDVTPNEKVGVEIIREACRRPFLEIVNNCGINSREIREKVIKSKYRQGYNAKELRMSDLKADGVMDAKKVTRVALESALSCAASILTTDAVIYPYNFEDKVVENQTFWERLKNLFRF